MTAGQHQYRRRDHLQDVVHVCVDWIAVNRPRADISDIVGMYAGSSYLELPSMAKTS